MRLRRLHAVAFAVALGLVSGPAAGEEKAGSTTPPLPPPRPAAVEPGSAPASRDTGSSENTCAARITQLGARFETRPALQDGACGGSEIVLLSALPGGVAVSPPATMACPVAEALSRWTVDVIAPEANRHLQETPSKLRIGTSYECRDQRSGTKLSEHAFANAIDVMGFEFGNRSSIAIGVSPPASPEAAFQDAVRKGACPLFTTVLGPGSDAAHADHLHLDLRGRNGGYRICQ